MSNPVIVYRESLMPADELEAAKAAGFSCYHSRMLVKPGDLVIARYSALPFYREQEEDYRLSGAKMINSLLEHSYVADLQNSYADLQDMTPKTWFRLEDAPRDEAPFILKGATNSKKHLWNTHCYAETWRDASRVHSNLTQDGLIGDQSIYVRKYVPLHRLGTALNGLPLTKEFRFFVCYGQILTGGFYWEAFEEDILLQGGTIPSVDEVPTDFLAEAVRRVSPNVPFFVIDVAQTQTKDWIVVELNDGAMSGLSANKPEVLYPSLLKAVLSYGH